MSWTSRTSYTRVCLCPNTQSELSAFEPRYTFDKGIYIFLYRFGSPCAPNRRNNTHLTGISLYISLWWTFYFFVNDVCVFFIWLVSVDLFVVVNQSWSPHARTTTSCCKQGARRIVAARVWWHWNLAVRAGEEEDGLLYSLVRCCNFIYKYANGAPDHKNHTRTKRAQRLDARACWCSQQHELSMLNISRLWTYSGPKSQLFVRRAPSSPHAASNVETFPRVVTKNSIHTPRDLGNLRDHIIITLVWRLLLLLWCRNILLSRECLSCEPLPWVVWVDIN